MINSQLLQQFRREAEAWKRLLEFLQSENVHLKTRIAEIAADDLPEELLSEVENFQNRSIRKDEMIGLARLQVAGFRNQLSEENVQFINIENILQVHKSLKDHIEILELGFNKLKSDFNHYLKQKL
jgi:hypothetical protein